MKKEDAPRLKNFLGSLMRQTYKEITGKDMLMLVKDMQWLSDVAENLEKKPADGQMKILDSKPIDDKSPPKSGKAKSKT